MKTKYIKVSVADRLPEETGRYHTEYGHMDFNEENGLFYDHIEGFVMRPDFFFEPVPDREEEMREMLERCLESLNWISQNCILPTIENEFDAEEQAHHVPYRIQELNKFLNELKQL